MLFSRLTARKRVQPKSKNYEKVDISSDSIAVYIHMAQMPSCSIMGSKAGIGFSSLKFDDVTGINDGSDVYDLITGDGVMGYHVGLQTRIKIAMIVIQPELYFNAGGGTVEQVVEGGATEVLNVKFNRIDIPFW